MLDIFQVSETKSEYNGSKIFLENILECPWKVPEFPPPKIEATL